MYYLCLCRGQALTCSHLVLELSMPLIVVIAKVRRRVHPLLLHRKADVSQPMMHDGSPAGVYSPHVAIALTVPMNS